MNKEKDKIQYPTFTVRLSKETIQLLKQRKIESGLSWNRFIYKLLDKERKDKNKKKEESFKKLNNLKKDFEIKGF